MDDWRGVGESLNETTGGVTPYPDWVHQGSGITVRGTYAILVSPLANGLKELRQGMDEAYLPAYPLFTPAARATLASGDARPAPSEIASLTGGAALPINVHLLTLEPWSHNQLLVRLAHQFAVDEDPLYSQDAIVDLGALLSRYTVKGATEMSLSANMERSEMEARRLQWTHTDVDAAASATSFTEEGEEDEEARRLNIFHKPKHRPAPNDMPHPPARDPAKDSAAADAAAAAAAAAVIKKSSKDVHGAQAHSAPGDPFHKHRLPPIEFPHPPPAKAAPAAPAAELAEGAAAHKPSEHGSEYLSRHAQFLAAARANAIKQANLKGKGFVSPFHKHPPPPNDFPHPPERVPETETPGAEKGRGKAGAGPRAGAGPGPGPGAGPGGRGIRSDGPPRRDPHGAPGPFPDHRPPPNDFPLPHRGGDGHGGGHGEFAHALPSGHGGGHGEFAHALPSGRIEHGPVRGDRGDVPDSRHLATVEAPSDVGVSPPAPQGSLDGDTHNDFPHRRLSGDADLTVTLTPMQVRTFIVDVSV